MLLAGVLSRSALLTFAARGWQGPVSSLPRVRLAISSWLLQLPIPLSREVLLAIGCVPADKATLKQQLLCGTSIAVSPGGCTEPTQTGKYDLLLRQRTGFVALARETKAVLVPVLCLGEHLVAAAPDLLGRPEFNVKVSTAAHRLVISHKPDQPVHVVFGEPVVPADGESIEQVHARYIAALLSLGQQHGVTLNII